MESSHGSSKPPRPAFPPGAKLAPKHPEDPYDLDFTALAEDLPPPAPRPPPTPDDKGLIGILGAAGDAFHVVVTRPHPEHAHNRVVLLVDDDVKTGARAAHALREAKYVPVLARSPKEAAAHMNKIGAPALILLAIDLPEVDGFTFLERLRQHKRLRDTPVIIFTAHSHPDDVIRGLMAGADGYVAKPIAAPALVAAVKAVLGE